jgi:organic hydroperoxide reductase OsmC/OhrA
VTLVAVAERRAVPIRALEVSAAGVVGRREDGQFGFTEIELEVDVGTDAGFEEEALSAAEAAERGCLVSVSLDAPVHVRCRVGATSAAA